MSLTASELIDTAIARNYGQLGMQRISKASLIAELSFQDETIVHKLVQMAPDLLATQVATPVTITTADNATGYTLQDGLHYRDFSLYNPTTDAYTPITMIRWESIDSPPRNPAGVVRLNTTGSGAIFYPSDPNGNRWTLGGTRGWYNEGESETFVYSYVAPDSPISKLTDTLRSPDMARPTLIASLALRLLVSNPRASQAALQAAMQEYTAAMSDLMFNAVKFTHPAGTVRGPELGVTEAEWVMQQVGH